MLACLVFNTVNLTHDNMLCKLINDVTLGIYPILDMFCLICDLGHRHLACYTRDMIFVTGTWYLHRHTIIDTNNYHAIFNFDNLSYLILIIIMQ